MSSIHPERSLDVHQHLWPTALVEELRRRTTPPRLDGWTLYLDGEPPYQVEPAHHELRRRRALATGLGDAVLGLSTPLGIEELKPEESESLLTAWHDGVRELGSPFSGWAALNHHEPDIPGLRSHLTDPESGLVGLQLSATELVTPAAVETWAPVLELVQELGRPVFVHPGPAHPPPGTPAWWAPVVDYSTQLQAAWWSWHAVGRRLLPSLRICFAAGAGLAPLSHERFRARGGGPQPVDPDVYVDTSSYGRHAIDGLTRALGIDTVVLGSDYPYATAADPHLGEAAWRAISVTNPHRLIEGDSA